MYLPCFIRYDVPCPVSDALMYLPYFRCSDVPCHVSGALMYLNEATLLNNVRLRYNKDNIYVSHCCTLVAVTVAAATQSL